MSRSTVPKSDIMGVAEAVEVSSNRVILENKRGRQYVLPTETMRKPNLDLTTVFTLGDKVAYKANHMKVDGYEKKLYVAVFVKKVDECQKGDGVICDIQATYGSIKSKNSEKKIFFPAGAFGDYRADIFYHKIKDCKKFFRINDSVTYTAVQDSPGGNLYCLNFDLRMNEDETKPFVGIVVELTTDHCRLWVKNYNSLRLNSSEIWPQLVDIKSVLEIGNRVEFTCDNFPQIENVRLLDDIAKIRLEKYKKTHKTLLNPTTVVAEKRNVVSAAEKSTEDNVNEIFDKNSSNVNDEIMPVHVTTKGLATVKSVKPSYCVLYSSKVGDVLVLVSDWLHYKDDRTSVGKERKIDLRKELVIDELVYFEGYFYPGHTRDGYRADRVEKTVQGRAVVSRLSGTYGFMYSPTYNEIFFAGAVMLDDFCGLRNLEKTLRINDEIRFVAIKERDGRGVYTSFKAVAAVLPSMGKENDENCIGVVVDVTTSYAKLYCRPLGPVFLTFRQPTDSVSVKLGQRLKFTCRRFNGRYEAFGGVYETLPNDFVFKFSQPSTIATIADSTVAAKLQSPRLTTHSHDEQFDNIFNKFREANINSASSRRRGFEQDDAKMEDFCWSDLEKELEEITCDFPVENPSLSSSSSSSSPPSSSGGTIDLGDELQSTDWSPATNPTFAPQVPFIATNTDQLFNTNSYFSAINNNNMHFVNNNNVNGYAALLHQHNNNNSHDSSEKDLWSIFSPATVTTDLSQTQTSGNDETTTTTMTHNPSNGVNFSPMATSPGKFIQSLSVGSPVTKAVTKRSENVVNVTQDVECQTDFVEEKSSLLNELMNDCEIFKFVAQHKPNLVYKYSIMQKR